MKNRTPVRSIKNPVVALLMGLLTNLFLALPSFTAEQVSVKYEGKIYSLSIEQIEQFLLTGQSSAPLPAVLKNNPLLRLTALQILYQDIPLSVITKGTHPKILESITSAGVLSQVGQIIRPGGEGDGSAALRTALNASIQEGKFNPMRFIKSFPDREIVIDGDRWNELQKIFTETN